MKRPRPRGDVRWQLVVGLLFLALALASVLSRLCLTSGLRYGLWANECPDGEPRAVLTVSAEGLTRGASAPVRIALDAFFVGAESQATRSVSVSAFEPTVALVALGQETPLSPAAPWARAGKALVAELALPRVNDGEYTLRTRVRSRLGEATLDLPLPLYSPATLHLLTDRPLYEPGNTVKFRALVLRASDLTPLEERPGVWRVMDPSGEVLLEEKAPSGPWGVVAGSFPLERAAPSGEWTVSWSSGDAATSRHFTVQPFTLPRFHVEVEPLRPYFRAGERPTLKGAVKYASGAPVAGARVALRWSFSGPWPPPARWTDGTALPRLAVSDPTGHFSVALPAVPADLQGQATAVARLAVTDAAGDRVEAVASVLLSEDAIAVSWVSELADGLVEGFNNRLFLRATTADGQPLTGVTLNVKRRWEPTDPGTDAEVDVDGVARLQVDPGPAVNIVVPALPARPPPPVEPVRREALSNHLAGGPDDADVTLADRIRLDGLTGALGRCVRLAGGPGGRVIRVGILVHASGAVGGVSAPTSPLGECVAAVARSLRFEGGAERLFDARWAFDDRELPRFQASLEGVPSVPDGLQAALEAALLGARDCLPATARSGRLPVLLQWQAPATRGRRSVATTWVPARGEAFGEPVLRCLTTRVSTLTLPDAEEAPRASALGVARISVVARDRTDAEQPQDTVMVGYEFLVTARRGKASLGSTRVRVTPGQVPAVRLRASEQVIEPGGTVEVELVRGPDFTGQLPEKLVLRHAAESVEAVLGQETRRATFPVPLTWQGWAAISWGGGQVFFFVRPGEPLSVSLRPEQPRYAPGQLARLAIDTRVGTTPGPAAVGLFGVDESLGQLAALPGADELSALRPQPQGEAVLGGLDAQALALGRVRGANAAAATLLRIRALPPAQAVEAAVRVRGRTPLDAEGTLIDHFYGVLAELAAQVRDWEASAPRTEKLRPATLAVLWTRALVAVEQRHQPAADVWGRRLRLHRLPPDLLALTEPRQLIVDGTRLPEDMQNWAQWVAAERP